MMMPPSDYDGNHRHEVQSQRNQGQGQGMTATTKSKQDTADFVHELSPILADLGELFDFYSMNDPSRV